MANVNKVRNFRNRVLKLFLLALIILQACQQPREQKQDTPNIIFIMADDLGYGVLPKLTPAAPSAPLPAAHS